MLSSTLRTCWLQNVAAKHQTREQNNEIMFLFLFLFLFCFVCSWYCQNCARMDDGFSIWRDASSWKVLKKVKVDQYALVQATISHRGDCNWLYDTDVVAVWFDLLLLLLTCVCACVCVCVGKLVLSQAIWWLWVQALHIFTLWILPHWIFWKNEVVVIFMICRLHPFVFLQMIGESNSFWSIWVSSNFFILYGVNSVSVACFRFAHAAVCVVWCCCFFFFFFCLFFFV